MRYVGAASGVKFERHGSPSLRPISATAAGPSCEIASTGGQRVVSPYDVLPSSAT